MKFTTKHLLLILLCSVTTLLQAQIVFKPGEPLPPELPDPWQNGSRAQTRDGSNLPKYIDNSLSEYFPKIINQTGGSCAAASSIHYMFTYEINRMLERKNEGKSANTFSYRWVWHLLNGGKDEGTSQHECIEMTKVAGCITAADFGDQTSYDYRWPSGYNKYYNGMHYKTTSSYYVNLRTMDGITKLMKYMLDKNDGHPGGGVAAFGITSKNWSNEYYDGPSETGYKRIINLKGTTGNHGMTLVGYDLSVEADCNKDGIISDEEKGAFILVNSWGSYWGTNGHAYIPFYYFLHTGEQDEEDENSEPSLSGGDNLVLCITTEYREPTAAIRIKFSYSSRNDITIRFGLADGAQATKSDPYCKLEYPYPKNQGGEWNMQGTSFTSGNMIEMGFDVSDLKDKANAMKAPCWIIIIGKEQYGKLGSGRVLETTLYDYENDTVYDMTYSSQEGEIVKGYGNMFKIPTKRWFKNQYNQWYEAVETTCNTVLLAQDYTKPLSWDKAVISVRKADGGYAKVKVKSFNPQNRKMTLDIIHYE